MLLKIRYFLIDLLKVLIKGSNFMDNYVSMSQLFKNFQTKYDCNIFQLYLFNNPQNLLQNDQSTTGKCNGKIYELSYDRNTDCIIGYL